MTSIQAQAFRSNWSDLPLDCLDTIAKCIARDRAAAQPFRRKLCSVGYSSLMPVCNKWMQFAREKTLYLLLTHLAEHVGVDEAEIFDMQHLDITEQFAADNVARLWYFRNFHSLKVSLNYQGQPAFEYYQPAEVDGIQRRRAGRLKYNLTSLQAAFNLRYLTSLNLTTPSGDCFGQFPWETMTSLRELHTHFTGRVAQGTFGFLPRIPQLEHLQADVDFFSVPSLGCITSLKSLDICLALPEAGVVDVAQARERDDDVLYQIRNLTGLEKLDFCQQATSAGLVWLTELTSLTKLSLRLPHTSPVGLNLWSVVKLFKSHEFKLQYLHFEFKLDGHFAVAYLDDKSQHSANQPEVDMSFHVPWSLSEVAIKKLFEHE